MAVGLLGGGGSGLAGSYLLDDNSDNETTKGNKTIRNPRVEIMTSAQKENGGDNADNAESTIMPSPALPLVAC